MKATTLAALLGLALAIVWIAGACLVDRRSEGLTCTLPTDCTKPRVCEGGVCVINPVACPVACDSCNLTVSPHLCKVTDTGGTSFTCPAGLHCDIDCASSGACHDITCANGSTCTINCTADGACQDIDCGSGGCDVRCTVDNACSSLTCGANNTGVCDLQCLATGACGSVTCDDACSCAVVCASGACGTNTCPSHGNGANTVHCTATGSTGAICTTTQPGCTSC